MSSTLDDIAFLANSEYRVAVLQSLLDGPYSRHVIAEKTDIHRVTLGRILDELENKQWVSQYGQVCEITSNGEWVIGKFTAFRKMIEAERRLRQVVQWFPKEGYGFHISRLANAELTLVSRADASAPISRLLRQFEVGGTVQAFSFAITREFLEACYEHVIEGSVTWEWVFTTDVLDVLRNNQEMASWSRKMLASGRAKYRLYQGDIPHVVIISDEMVNLRLADEAGAATALIQSDHDEVRAWAERTFEEYWSEGVTVEAEMFTP